MTNKLFNPQPSYSGVTIQISNPAVNVSPYNQAGNCSISSGSCCDSRIQSDNINNSDNPNQNNVTNPMQQGYPMAYPPQYYLNNYNTNVNGGLSDDKNTNNENAINGLNSSYKDNIPSETSDMTRSDNIIEDLNNRAAELKEQQKNTKDKKIIALTDDYIKSLENYLDNPNDEVRVMASKEVLKRLDEDKDRYDDAALNALLNKMMQDPSKIVRLAALSSFSSGLASGNDYTVKLLKDIQTNPKSDKEDVLQAADALLKMSADFEIKKVPIPEQTNVSPDKNQ